MNHLRRISVFVDETEPGQFYWVLHESNEDATVWTDVESSADAFITWMEAFDEGCIALFKLVPDERAGPRAAASEGEGAAPGG